MRRAQDRARSSKIPERAARSGQIFLVTLESQATFRWKIKLLYNSATKSFVGPAKFFFNHMVRATKQFYRDKN